MVARFRESTARGVEVLGMVEQDGPGCITPAADFATIRSVFSGKRRLHPRIVPGVSGLVHRIGDAGFRLEGAAKVRWYIANPDSDDAAARRPCRLAGRPSSPRPRAVRSCLEKGSSVAWPRGRIHGQLPKLPENDQEHLSYTFRILSLTR